MICDHHLFKHRHACFLTNCTTFMTEGFNTQKLTGPSSFLETKNIEKFKMYVHRVE